VTAIPDDEREAIVAQQVHLTTGGHTDRARCYVLLADFWRSAADMCQEAATHRVCVDDYRCGVTVDGVFSPAETYTVVCAVHEEQVRGAPGFRWSAPLKCAAGS
jgi:hypothetical protein